MDDARRFEALFQDNVRIVNAFASARLGRDAGEDVTSEVFHAAVVAYRSGRIDEVTTPWLMAVARNKVIDRWRSAGRRKARAHLVRESEDDLVSFPADWAEDGRREAVFNALTSVSGRHRMLLILHHVDGLPIAEIAAAIGQSDEAVESALVRARQSFRRHYRPEEVVSS